MLDLNRLNRVRLRKRPWGQIVVANLGLGVDYAIPRKTEIVLEGLEKLPRGRGVIFAMNHTDRYNYWPFQYKLYRMGLGFTATWVKGKYYENRAIGAFMDACNNIPMPSRGYVLVVEFRRSIGRPPTEEEYRLIRDRLDGRVAVDAPLGDDASEDALRFLARDGDPGTTIAGLSSLFERMIDRVLELMESALSELEQHILIFPQGTRSKRLTPGHTGLVEVAQRFGAPIVPVGCSGSDRLYPSSSPFSKGGRVVYRLGEPLLCDSGPLAPYRVPQSVRPLTLQASGEYGDNYRAMTDIVMQRINELVDPEYRFEEAEERGVVGVDRFV